MRDTDHDPATRRVPPLLDRVAAIAWRFIVIVGAVSLLVYALIQLRLVVLPVIVALFLGSGLRPVSERLRGRGLPDALAAGAALLLGLLLLAGVVVFVVLEVVDEVDALTTELTGAVDEIEDWFVDGPLGIERDTLDDARDRIGRSLRSNSEGLTSGAVRAGTLLIEVVTGTLLAIVLLFFVLKDGHRAGRAVARVFPEEQADDLRDLGVKVWSTIGGYLRGVAITGVVDATLIGIGIALLGVPLVVPLMLLTFVGAFIPLVGATTAGVVAALVALVSNGPSTALAVGALVLVIQQVEGDVLAPLVLGRAVQLHAVTILLSLTAGGLLAGVVGAFLAVPVAAVTKTIITHYRPGVAPNPSDDGPDDDDEPPDGDEPPDSVDVADRAGEVRAGEVRAGEVRAGEVRAASD